jgi:hypothetical protein
MDTKILIMFTGLPYVLWNKTQILTTERAPAVQVTSSISKQLLWHIANGKNAVTIETPASNPTRLGVFKHIPHNVG